MIQFKVLPCCGRKIGYDCEESHFPKKQVDNDGDVHFLVVNESSLSTCPSCKRKFPKTGKQKLNVIEKHVSDGIPW
jgi:hypothetical protein